MVEGNCPVLTEELYCVGNDSVLITVCKLVEVVLMEANETPETLKDDLLVAHVRDGINQPNVVECELDEVAFAS